MKEKSLRKDEKEMMRMLQINTEDVTGGWMILKSV